MKGVNKARIADASRLKSLLGFEKTADCETFIRNRYIIYDDFLMSAAICGFPDNENVLMHFIGRPDESFAGGILRYFFFEKKFYKVSCVLPVSMAYNEEVLINSGFVQEAVLHRAVKTDDGFEDAALYYVILPEYPLYNVGFIPFQRGLISISGGVDFVDDITFLNYDKPVCSEYLRLCAEYSGFIKDGHLKSRGDACYKEYEPSDLPAEVMRATEEIKEYLRKERTSFDIIVKLPKASDFRLTVWELLKKIPYGFTKSYEDIAIELTGGDIPSARKLTRAVGHACSENPVPILIPCHRVIGKDGRLVGFKDGVEFKDFLLTHELFAAVPLN